MRDITLNLNKFILGLQTQITAISDFLLKLIKKIVILTLLSQSSSVFLCLFLK